MNGAIVQMDQGTQQNAALVEEAAAAAEAMREQAAALARLVGTFQLASAPHRRACFRRQRQVPPRPARHCASLRFAHRMRRPPAPSWRPFDDGVATCSISRVLHGPGFPGQRRYP